MKREREREREREGVSWARAGGRWEGAVSRQILAKRKRSEKNGNPGPFASLILILK